MRANITNFGYSTLASGISSFAPSFSVATGGGATFPAVNSSTPDAFTVTIDSEIILCSARGGDAFTVSQRGYEGTLAASHLAGAPVVGAPTAGELMRPWSVLADAHDPDVPPVFRGGTASAYDDDFEEGDGNIASSGGWTFAPQDSGQYHSFGTTYRSMFDFHRADTSGGCYFLYRPFTPGASTAFTVTAKLSHGGSFSLPNEYQASLFVSDSGTPSSSQEGGFRSRVDSVISASIPSLSTLPWQMSPTTAPTPRLVALRGSYDASGTWRPMTTSWGGASASPAQGQLYLSLSFDGASTWNAWAGDGLTFQHLGYCSNAFVPASMGFRFYADHAPTGRAYNHAMIDWVRVQLVDRAVYNSLPQ